MNVVLYTNDGEKVREFQCDKVSQRSNGWTMFIKDDNVFMYATSQYSFVASQEGAQRKMCIDMHEPKWKISIRFRDAVREWKDVSSWNYQGEVVSFYDGGKWWDVFGQVIIEKQEK
jgi:hypothetical protein